MDHSDILWTANRAYRVITESVRDAQNVWGDENRRRAEHVFINAWIENTGRILTEMQSQHASLSAADQHNKTAEEQIRVAASNSDDVHHYAKISKELAVSADDRVQAAMGHIASTDQFISEVKNLISAADSAGG